MMEYKNSQGYTLIELMIALVILGIMFAWGYGQYQKHSLKGNLAAAKAAMLEDADYLEHFFTKHYAYSTYSRQQSDSHCLWPEIPKTRSPGFEIHFEPQYPQCNAQHYLLYARPDKKYQAREKRYLRMDEDKNVTICEKKSGQKDQSTECLVN